MLRPGKRNLITDIDGILVGNAEDANARTGTTVLTADRRMVAAVDVRGGGPGTRETDALRPAGLVEAVDAIVLSGGSVYGLDAASGVTTVLAEEGRGFEVAGRRVPIVPAAILFDLSNGGDKGWGAAPPYRALGIQAMRSAGRDFALGNAGSGLGAKAGRLKGGLGSASIVDEASGITVGALVAANPAGSVVMPGSACFWGWALEQAGELGRQPRPNGPVSPEVELPGPAVAVGANTTIAIVATDARLSRDQLLRVAMMAQDGIARAVRPAHTPFDGDTVFAVSVGDRPLAEPFARSLAILGALAADTLTRALMRGVFEADSLGDKPGYRSLHGHALGRS